MKAGPDASICNLLGEGHRAGPTMGYTGGCRACHCYLGNVVSSEHGFDDARDAAAQDAMGARVFRVRRRVAERLPSKLARDLSPGCRQYRRCELP